MATNAGEEMKVRLRGDLKAAMKDKRPEKVKVLRALIAALDNAEAPSNDGRSMAIEEMGGLGSSEVQRLALDAERVRAILTVQQTERETAAIELDRVGRAELAAASRAEAALIGRYLA